MIWMWIAIALIACYAVFLFGPALVGYLMIFRGAPGKDVSAITSPDGQLHPYAALLRSANERLMNLPHEEVSIRSNDGITLTGTYFDRKRPKTAIFVHGYRTDPQVNFSVQAEAFARHGYNLLLIRQRGHAPGSKDRCTMGLRERFDAAAWNDWALSTDGVTETVLYGISMGAVSIALGADRFDPEKTRAMLLDCGFRSPYEQIGLDCARRHIPPWTMLPLIRLFAKLFLSVDIREKTDTHLHKTSVPCFFLHGKKDLTVPYETGLAQYEACAAKKAFFTAENAGHTESFLSDPERAENEIFTFLGEEQTGMNKTGGECTCLNS